MGTGTKHKKRKGLELDFTGKHRCGSRGRGKGIATGSNKKNKKKKKQTLKTRKQENLC